MFKKKPKSKNAREKRTFKKREREEGTGVEWAPKTLTGRLVQRGEIASIEQIYSRNLPLMEPEIVDFLLPGLTEEVLDIHTVQRATDSGRKMRFLATVAVGDKNGHVGVGVGKGANVKPAIERATVKAKLNITNVNRGCGSWECGCGGPHSVPFKVEGRTGSVRVTLLPAPKGTGLVAGNKCKKVLELAGVRDVWTKTGGDARTTFNFAQATVDALKNTRRLKGIEEVKEDEKARSD